MGNLFFAANGPAPTTAAQAAVTTGTAIKTMMQLATPSTSPIRIVEWGISFDGAAAATPIKCELLQTDVAATVTAYVAADIIKYTNPGEQATILTLSTTASGYTGTAEGTITATRMFDVQYVAPTNQYVKQFPLGREPFVQVSKFVRIRVTTGTAVNCYCYCLWEE